MRFNDGKKSTAGTKRDSPFFREREKARKRGLPCIIKGKRINLSNTRDRNFPRDAPRFSYQCNGESFNAGPADDGENLARERATHVRETGRRKRRLDHTYARANAHAVTYAELGRRVHVAQNRREQRHVNKFYTNAVRVLKPSEKTALGEVGLLGDVAYSGNCRLHLRLQYPAACPSASTAGRGREDVTDWSKERWSESPGWSAFLNNRASETLDISSERRASHAAKRLLATHEYNMGINKSKQAPGSVTIANQRCCPSMDNALSTDYSACSCLVYISQGIPLPVPKLVAGTCRGLTYLECLSRTMSRLIALENKHQDASIDQYSRCYNNL
ncbi:hypothetical protein ALC57_04322 [Trachymyrmex cornetzi]|uniref:Uncharacterized protein n=1 Tax=Trachymyrmex cornetzi TaxID=471704 RepID=A0A195EE19_9HYME|nr:hypothetical protein ALC57_04322 [Trachymyrmex cornetzi]